MKRIVLAIWLSAVLFPCSLAGEITDTVRILHSGKDAAPRVQTEQQVPNVDRRGDGHQVIRGPDSASAVPVPAPSAQVHELDIEKESSPVPVPSETTEPIVSNDPQTTIASDSTPTVSHKQPDLAQAWGELQRGNLAPAHVLFNQLAADPVAEKNKEARLGLAYTLIRMGEDQPAASLLMQLAHAGYRPLETVPQAFDLALQQGDMQGAASLLTLFPSADQPGRRFSLEREAARRAVAVSTPLSRAERVALEELLRLDPADTVAREKLGWHCLRTGDHACALHIFTLLHESTPENMFLVEGLVLALQGAGHIDEALDLLDSNPSPQLASLHRSLLLQAAMQKYTNDAFEAAVHQLRAAARSAPLARGEQEVLIWALARSGRESEALDLVKQLYRNSEDLTSAQMVFDLFDLQRNNQSALDFARELGQSADSSLRRLGADRLARSGLFRSAARVSTAIDACYWNCDSPDFGTGLVYRYRDGDAGTSRLHRLDVPIEVRYPLAGPWRVSAGVVHHTLDSGQGEDVPYMGSYYQAIATGTMLRAPETTVKAWSPFLTLDTEGPQQFLLQAGTTPLNGPIHPMPTFFVRYADADVLHIQIHQRPMQDSLLSFVGQRDPYTHKDWGRVLRTGVTVTRNLSLDAGFWLSLQAGADYYWGYNTEENTSVSSTASFGRTRSLNGAWETSTGVFANLLHFRRNSDFQTYGHGGYFSPELFAIAGPFFRVTKTPCTQWFIDFETSLGLKYSETSSASRYVGAANPEKGNFFAEQEFTGKFAGETETGLAFSARLTTMHLITSNWAWGGFAGINTASDHQELEGGLFIRYFFTPRNAVCDPGQPSQQRCRW
jgi:hypothetical protein